MGKQTLNIQLDKNGRGFFNSFNEKIAIVKPYSILLNYKVVCAYFSPTFGTNNTIVFDENYSIYATTQVLDTQPKLAIGSSGSSIKAQIGNTYILKDSGFQSSGIKGVKNEYGFSNQLTKIKAVTCGLAQNINVNSQGEQLLATCADYIPNNQNTYFQDDATVWVFAGKGLSTNSVIDASYLQSSTASKNYPVRTTFGFYLEIDLNTTDTIHFDSNTHLFQKGPLGK